MLTKILSVSGKPGLYKLISTSKNMNIVESLVDGKRIPIYLSEKAVALSDVSIYTEEEDVPLREVFAKIKEKEGGKKVAIDKLTQNKDLFAYFAEILPTYDRNRVYASDIKKLIGWYNILIENNIDFEAENNASESTEMQEEKFSTLTNEARNEVNAKHSESSSKKADSKSKKVETQTRSKH
jgi:hypothetical protein